MSLLKQNARVQAARVHVRAARHELSTPAAALLARGREHPLATVGAAAGAGFVLGSLNVPPLRVPGLVSLLGGGLAEAVAYGTRLLAEVGAMGLGAAAAGGSDAGGGESA
jgi:hypothetical protein